MPTFATLLTLATTRQQRALRRLQALQRAIASGELSPTDPHVVALLNLHKQTLDNASTLLELVAALNDATHTLKNVADLALRTPGRGSRR